MTWVVVLFNLIMATWIVFGTISAVSFQSCELEATPDMVAACEAGTAIGAGAAVFMLVFLWVAGNVILGVLWLVTNRTKTRDCPTCGSDVKKGVTTCKKCGYDFELGRRPQQVEVVARA